MPIGMLAQLEIEISCAPDDHGRWPLIRPVLAAFLTASALRHGVMPC